MNPCRKERYLLGGPYWAFETSEDLNEPNYSWEGNGTPLQYSCLEIPWTEEPGRLQSWGRKESNMTEETQQQQHENIKQLGRVKTESFIFQGHDFHFSLSFIGEGNGNPLQCSCLENPSDRGAWWAAISGVAQSRTRLKRLSSSNYSWIATRQSVTQPALEREITGGGGQQGPRRSWQGFKKGLTEADWGLWGRGGAVTGTVTQKRKMINLLLWMLPSLLYIS